MNKALPHKHGTAITAWSDGYAFAIDAKLKEQLTACVDDRFPFVIDGFKSLTRNVEKLFIILEFLMSRWTPLVTTNYFIANVHIERRLKPLKAGHSHDEMFRNCRNTNGLGEYHKHYLDVATGKI